MYNTFKTLLVSNFHICVVSKMCCKPFLQNSNEASFQFREPYKIPLWLVYLRVRDRERERGMNCRLRSCSVTHTGGEMRSCEIASDAHGQPHLHCGSREVPLREHQECDVNRCPPIGPSCSPLMMRANVCSSNSTVVSSCGWISFKNDAWPIKFSCDLVATGGGLTGRRAREGFDLYLPPLSTFYSLHINMLN